MKIINTNTYIEFSQAECYCEIIEFYDLIAERLGYDPQKMQYNCTKICVSKPVQDQIFRFYQQEKDTSQESIGRIWLQYGPKANLSQSTYIAEVQEGFFVEVRS